MIRLMAFSIDFLVMMSRGLRSFLMASSSTRAARSVLVTLSWSGLASVLEPNRLMPRASKLLLMVLAVYMPPHEPEPGTQRRSISLTSVSLMRPMVYSPTASKALTMVRSLPL